VAFTCVTLLSGGVNSSTDTCITQNINIYNKILTLTHFQFEILMNNFQSNKTFMTKFKNIANLNQYVMPIKLLIYKAVQFSANNSFFFKRSHARGLF
jgi:hypothetical protein